jgi:hypothetical protein
MKRIFTIAATPFVFAFRAIGFCVLGVLYLLTFAALIVLGRPAK